MTSEQDPYRMRIARRESSARTDLLLASHGTPNTPELSDEQLHDHSRVILDRARRIYEVWKTCGGAIPQPLSVAIMDFRRECVSANCVKQEVAHVES